MEITSVIQSQFPSFAINQISIARFRSKRLENAVVLARKHCLVIRRYDELPLTSKMAIRSSVLLSVVVLSPFDGEKGCECLAGRSQSRLENSRAANTPRRRREIETERDGVLLERRYLAVIAVFFLE